MEHNYHCPLISGPNVFQPEWHYLVEKGSPRSNEGCLLFILVGHFEIVVSKETIHEGVH
jgi:hypothetical protein